MGPRKNSVFLLQKLNSSDKSLILHLPVESAFYLFVCFLFVIFVMKYKKDV